MKRRATILLLAAWLDLGDRPWTASANEGAEGGRNEGLQTTNMDNCGPRVLVTGFVKDKPFTADFQQRDTTVEDGRKTERLTCSGMISRDTQGRVRREVHLPTGVGGFFIGFVAIVDPLRQVVFAMDLQAKTFEQSPLPSTAVDASHGRWGVYGDLSRLQR